MQPCSCAWLYPWLAVSCNHATTHLTQPARIHHKKQCGKSAQMLTSNKKTRHQLLPYLSSLKPRQSQTSQKPHWSLQIQQPIPRYQQYKRQKSTEPRPLAQQAPQSLPTHLSSPPPQQPHLTQAAPFPPSQTQHCQPPTPLALPALQRTLPSRPVTARQASSVLPAPHALRASPQQPLAAPAPTPCVSQSHHRLGSAPPPPPSRAMALCSLGTCW